MKLNFVKIANRWYVQIPDYTDGVDDLELTGGTEAFCEKLDESGCGSLTLGLPIGEANDRSGDGMAIGFPVGAGVGLLTGLTTPGRTYKANDGDYVWLELTQDLVIPN